MFKNHKSQLSKEQVKDTGLAMVLITLLFTYWGHSFKAVPLALVLLLITMIWPEAYRPLAVVWFKFSHLIGQVMTKLLLSMLFFILLTPIGLIRSFLGRDPMQLKKWKRDEVSVFKIREYMYIPQDLERPF